MTPYKQYEKQPLDRYDLKWSVYIAALDVQFANHLPYFWTFCLDCTGEVFFGRSWQDLREFFDILESEGGFGYNHKILVYVNDLTEFFNYGRTQLYIEKDHIVARDPAHIYTFQSRGLVFRDFQIYTEKDIDKYIKINAPAAEHVRPCPDGLSSECELSEAEQNYSALRVLEMSKAIRRDLDFLYQGNTKEILLTKTRRIEKVMKDRLKKDDPSTMLTRQIYNLNPISSRFGKAVVLPKLRKAFFGGTVWAEKGTLNELVEGATFADLTSAYCAEFLLSKFPVGKFKILDIPQTWQEMLENGYYSKKALLIHFEARTVKLKRGAVPVLPADMKHYYIDKHDKDDRADAALRSRRAKLFESKRIEMCLTDIDFKLFTENYTFDDDIKIFGILGARYGYLPEYVIETVAQLYSSKRRSKQKYKKLKDLGLDTLLDSELYHDEKTALARLYGIFTQSPVVVRYEFDQEKKCLIVADPNYIDELQRFRPICYQWGVWTVAHVREKICHLRNIFKGDKKIRVYSGDTDCIVYKGDATHIITDFNAKIKQQIEERCEILGIDPAELKNLGELETENYKYYRMTALKQYAVVRETDEGDKFEAVCGGMNKACDYFQRRYPGDAKKQIGHFHIGKLITTDYIPPRVLHRQCSEHKKIDYVDRDGNRIRDEIYSYMIEEHQSYTLCDVFGDFKSKNKPAELTKGLSETTAADALAAAAERTSRIKTATPAAALREEKKGKCYK